IALKTATDRPSALGASYALSQQHQQSQLSVQQQDDRQQFSLSAKHFETDGFRPQSAARKQQLQSLWQYQLANELSLRLRLD
ncbi:hypothetical protein RSW32_25870, partial [Escherichia coli]|uniref:hypothetical protein n=1 Tax=Escherichia coli TaxID=562 RepID=UPI0028DE2933